MPMRRLSLSEWAAIGEIVGTVGVIVSLVFVIFSLNQNTAAIQGTSENTLFERHMDLANHFLTDASLASIMLKMRTGEVPLTEVETVRWEIYQLNLLDIWAMAYNRHQRDLLADQQWLAWDTYFVGIFTKGAPAIDRERWEELTYGFDADFWAHVGRSIFGTPTS